MRRIFLLFAMLLSVSAFAQDSDTFYYQCVKDILSIRDKWPTTKNWKGEAELIPFYDVDKATRMKFAEEFMKTMLYQRAVQQAQLPVGKMHQTDNKIIKSRAIGSVSFTANFHGDEYIINLSKDYSTKKWILEFSYIHNTYSTPPPTDDIRINIDGSQMLAGSKSSQAYCVIANIGRFRYEKPQSGLQVSDSSAERDCTSPDNNDFGKVSSWDLK